MRDQPLRIEFARLHHFQQHVFRPQREFFETLAAGQTPEVLFISCSDSRINPNSPVKPGMVSPYTPETKASVGLQYAIPMGGGGTLTPRVDLTYTDDVYSNAVNAETNHIDSQSLVNARLTWRSMADAWQVALEATNLTDEYYYVTLFDLSNAAAGYIHGQPSRPREVAMSVRRNF